MDANLQCYVVDDESYAVTLLSKFILATDGISLMGVSTNPLEAIKTVATKNGPQITFLDVNMQQMSGLDFAAAARNYTSIVFITSLPLIPQKIFGYDSFEYLPKPISYSRFLLCIERIKNKLKEANYSSLPPN